MKKYRFVEVYDPRTKLTFWYTEERGFLWRWMIIPESWSYNRHEALALWDHFTKRGTERTYRTLETV